MKICTSCKKEKEIVEFSKDRSTKDGLQYKCKTCVKLYNSDYYRDNKEDISAYQSEYYENNKEAILARMAEYRDLNKEVIAVMNAEYYENNKEVLAAKKAEYYENNKEAILVKKTEYYENNREAIVVRMAEYKKTPDGKASCNNSNQKRRALIKGGLVTTEGLKELITNNTTCFYCGCGITEDNRHIDHYVPLSKGGLHDLQNLVIACASCNTRKNDKMPEVFILLLPKEDQERIKQALKEKDDTDNIGKPSG